jgi:FAD/FMN-containing dehydrogenase
MAENNMPQFTDHDLEAFRGQLCGVVSTPGDPYYDPARSVWNGDINRHPAVIARCSTETDVVEALQFGRRHGLEIAVRGGGHSSSGASVVEGGLMVDLSPMRMVSVDPAIRRAVCGGGATLADLDAATQAHGLAVTTGIVSHTGVGGLTLGGGMGWLTHKAGLTIDNLVEAQVVTAEGDILRASADENSDLFWAIRGGGANFGVVTSFTYNLHQIGPIIQFGLFFYGPDQSVEALRLSRELMASLPSQAGALTFGISAPPEPFVPERYHFMPGYAVMVVGFGSTEEHERVVAPLRDALAPLFELVTPMPYVELQKMFDEAASWGLHAYDKALYLDDLSDDAITTLAEQLPRKESPLSLVGIYPLDGTYLQVADDETAFGGHRSSARYLVTVAAQCAEPAQLPAERAWVRSFWEALRPAAIGSGAYINTMSEYDEDRVRATYGPEKYERLASLKAKFDPGNVLHLNTNIKPAV